MKLDQQAGNLISRASGAAALLAAGEWGTVWRVFRRHVWSDSTSLGLQLDLAELRTSDDGDITVRELRPGDVPKLFDLWGRAPHGQDIYERQSRRRLLRTGIGIPYVAVDADGAPCYVLWMIGPEDNHMVQRYFRGRFPPLQSDEVLFEGAFTIETNRGKHLMTRGGQLIRARAFKRGARRALAFVDVNNIPSLKGCGRSGYMPYLIRLERRRLFRHTITFAPVDTSTLRWFDRLGQVKPDETTAQV